MTNPASSDTERLRQQASELADGQPQALDPVVQAWRDDDDLRQTWHAYQLIGDVLRSQDLAQPMAADERLLQRLRLQLDQEPALLAPAPLARPAAPAQELPGSWRPLHRVGALAAGVAALALFALWPQQNDDTQLAAGQTAEQASGMLDAAPALTMASNTGQTPMLRDARLDEYLRMHQMARGGGAMLIPGTGLRRVELALPVRSGP